LSASDSSRARFEVSTTTGLELFVRLVHLVDQQDDAARVGDGAQQRPLEQVLAREDVLRDLLAAQALVAVGLNAQELLLVVPLVERLRLIQAFVTLQADELGVQRLGQHLADLGLAGPGGALYQQRALQRQRQEEDRLDRVGGEVACPLQPRTDRFARDLHVRSCAPRRKPVKMTRRSRANPPTERRPPRIESMQSLQLRANSESATRVCRHTRRRPVHPLITLHDNRPVLVWITVCSARRKPILACDAAYASILAAWQKATAWTGGRYVILPDHIHFFCAPRDERMPLVNWMRYWRSDVSRHWHRPEEQPIWQTNFWDTRLRRGESYDAKWEYARNNPVRHGLVAEATAWPYAGELTVLERD
jgi:putative transposase